MHTGLDTMLQDKNLQALNHIETATTEQLNSEYCEYLNCDLDDQNSILNDEMRDFILRETYQCPKTKRLVMPCLWKFPVIHKISQNYNLAYNILMANIKKLKKNPDRLKQYNEVISQQKEEGIVEVVKNTSDLRKNKEIAFLAHNGVFRNNNDTTKCRIVYLSNLKEKSEQMLSHNEASTCGSNLNAKLSFALTLLRFDKFLLIFDIEKAFHQIQIRESDQIKLMFLWVKDIYNKNLVIEVFKFTRLPFGLRYSPNLLMMALYIILIKNTHKDSQKIKSMKELMYCLSYMDNIAFSTDFENELKEAYVESSKIFGMYQFKLQKFGTNCSNVQSEIDEANAAPETSEMKLFGLTWDRIKDEFKTNKLYLDPMVTTKRGVLSTLHANFDPLGKCIPLLNRAKLFLHSLQIDNSVNWDNKIGVERIKEWKKIAKQVNHSVHDVVIPRSIGTRADQFEILCFVDASKSFYGLVIYIRSLVHQELKFIMAKNKIVNKKLALKSIPLLELSAMELGVETLIELCMQFETAVKPINIIKLHLFSDSTISLSWLK